MSTRIPVLVALVVTLATGPARADCVDYSEARAKAAGEKLERSPPTAAQIGVPSLEGLKLDGPRTTGDPECGSGPVKFYYYSTSMTLGELVAAYYPNIKRRTETDGMNRTWFQNPYKGDEIILTSNTSLRIGVDSDKKINSLRIEPASTVLPLTVESQPYTAQEIVDWTPWPGGTSGPRQFVRADGATPQSAPAAAAASAPAAPAGAKPNCAPAAATADQASSDATAVGADVGGKTLGGGYGRNVGAAVGGLLGGLGKKKAQEPPPQPECK